MNIYIYIYIILSLYIYIYIYTYVYMYCQRGFCQHGFCGPDPHFERSDARLPRAAPLVACPGFGLDRCKAYPGIKAAVQCDVLTCCCLYCMQAFVTCLFYSAVPGYAQTRGFVEIVNTKTHNNHNEHNIQYRP